MVSRLEHTGHPIALRIFIAPSVLLNSVTTPYAPVAPACRIGIELKRHNWNAELSKFSSQNKK